MVSDLYKVTILVQVNLVEEYEHHSVLAANGARSLVITELPAQRLIGLEVPVKLTAEIPVLVILPIEDHFDTRR